MTQLKGIAIHHAVVWCSRWSLLAVVGWVILGQTSIVSYAQDINQPVFTNDNPNPGLGDRNLDGRNLDGRNLDKRYDDLQRTQKHFLTWMIQSSGIFGFLILLVAVAMIVIIMSIAVQLRRDRYLPSAMIEEFESQIQAKEYQGAYETAKNCDSFVGRILAAGMGRLSRGYDEAIEQMQQVGDDETMAMEHKIGYLALIGSIAPMLGLLGTVQGMVMSFQVIANSSTSPKPSELADGIATALFTTLEGLVVAIPAIVFYSLYKNRLARFLMESGYVADNLMKNFEGVPKPAPTTAQPLVTQITSNP